LLFGNKVEKFHYSARSQKGKRVKGVVEARDKKIAAKMLQEQGFVVISLRKIGEDSLHKALAFLSRVSSKDITNFTRQLSTMITAGLSLTGALAILQEQSNPAMGKIISEILKDIQGGSSLHKTMSKHKKVFSPVFLALIKAGEKAGVLDKVLNRLAINLEKQEEFKGKVKGAMIYPVIVVIGMIIVAVIMMVFVIPKLMTMYEEFGAELPAATKILMGVSSFFARFWILGLLGVFGLGYGLYFWRKTPVGREQTDRFLLKIPILGVLRQKVILTEITRTLSMLTHAGVSIIESLIIVADAANNVLFENAFRKAARDVEKGLPLAPSLSGHDFIPAVVTQMISVGEETGKIDEVLERVSIYFEGETEIAIKALTTAIEPLMMIMLGIGVGFLVIAIILPIYNLTAQF